MKQKGPLDRLFYDEEDYLLLEIVNKILARGKNPKLLRKLFEPGLHPRGIKELAAPKSLRIASAMIELLGTLEHGTGKDRIRALRAVRAEVLLDSSQTLRINSARVLLQIMKHIVRAGGEEEKQLSLIHDFRDASSGKPRLIRKLLKKYHLLEMPEDWNQLAFDHHVHDANTKGRKSPTHLIMDAWIKGIRFLGVIYHNYVKVEAASELLEAAAIMGIDVRIGVEVKARLNDRYIQLVWSPRGFLGRKDFLRFLEDPSVQAFFDEGKAVVEYEKKRVLYLLDRFNEKYLEIINQRFGLELDALDRDEFLARVGLGQPSLIHLSEYAYRKVLDQIEFKISKLKEDPTKLDELEKYFNQISDFDSESLVEDYLSIDSSETDLSINDEKTLPKLLRLNPEEVFDLLEELPTRCRITLIPSNLSAADVLEVLYEGKGRVTHLEIFNLKDWAQDHIKDRHLINELRLVINSGNIVEAKYLVHDIIERAQNRGEDSLIIERLTVILNDLKTLLGFYSSSRLKSRLGSDSVGLSRHTRGMGLAVVPTLPWRTRRQLKKNNERIIPVTTIARRYTMRVFGDRNHSFDKHRSRRDFLNELLYHKEENRAISWSVGHNATTLSESGNIATLGGKREDSIDESLSQNTSERSSHAPFRMTHLNARSKNIFKILLGFLPAFFTFFLTKDWWILAYFGAVIWFSITGLRNIIQSVVGGGGLKRSSLLHWKDLVSWSRVADSLLFTGFSVPLLDYLVKNLILAKTFQITTTTSPILLFTFMALANGIYISSHNTYRGLPIGAIVGNFFRTVISIPIAIGLNYLILRILLASGVTSEAALAGLQLWAAVISKTASDFVAAIIEGLADRQQNLSRRRLDYEGKLAQVHDVYGRLEVKFPEQEMGPLLEKPKELFHKLSEIKSDLLRDMTVDSLDLLYFWMYQPRARKAFLQQLEEMSKYERRFLLQSQQILKDKRIISEMLLNGLIGKRFERALAFYLSFSDGYLSSLKNAMDRFD